MTNDQRFVQALDRHDPASVGEYMLLGRLGRGGMGTVYLARSRGGRLVAVKVVRAAVADEPEFRERFRREVEMARMVGGFWTAAVVDADPEATRPWLATEYVAGPSLQQAVTAHGPLPEHSVRRLAAGLAEALEAIHTAGLVHRDLKPSNVLLAPDGPRVIDFGIARTSGRSTLTATGMFVGTPGFFSPEQISGEPVGPASDVFSLGAVLVYAATATGPFGDGDSSTLINRATHCVPDLRAVPPGLRDVVAACLRRDPAHRPTSTELLAQLGGTTASTPRTWLPEPVATLVDRHHTVLDGTATQRAIRPTPVSTVDRSVSSVRRPVEVIPRKPAVVAHTGERGTRTASVLWGILCLGTALLAWRLAAHPAPLGVPGRFFGIVCVLACLSASIALFIRAARARE